MTMPDPRGYAQTQFPPPGYQGVPAQVLDPNDPAFDNQPRPVVYARPDQQLPPGSEQVESEEYGDYFGADVRHRFMLPDGRSFIEFKEFTEGDVAQYQRRLKRDVVVEKATGDARIKIDQVEERHALIMTGVTGWNLMRRSPTGQMKPAPFSGGTPGSELAKWLSGASPKIVMALAEAIREKNPFLLGDDKDTIEAIDAEIENLTKKRQQILDRLQGNVDSASN